MTTTSNNQDIIPQDRAEELAEAFLKERHYNYDKVIFQTCEDVQVGNLLVYRFSGLLIEKTRALIEILARDKSSVTYKFVIEINSDSGRVLNYYLI